MAPSRRRGCCCPRRYASLLLLLLVGVARAQDGDGLGSLLDGAGNADTVAPTPAPALEAAEVEALTPDVELLSDILASDVGEELEQDQGLLDVLIQWEWQRLLQAAGNASSSSSDKAAPAPTNGAAAAPFVTCAEGGRAAVEAMQASWSAASPQARDADAAVETGIPYFAEANLTCYVVQGLPADVLNQAKSDEHVKYSIPLPSPLKLARGLFFKMTNGRLFKSTQVCNAGIRIVLSPGVGEDEAGVAALVASIQDDLATGAFREKLAATFPFANKTMVEEASNASTMAALARARVPIPSKQRLRRTMPAAEPTTTTTTTKATPIARAVRWWSRIKPVLSGELTCDWAALDISLQLPFLSLNGYCALVPDDVAKASSCLTVLVAFLASRTEVLFLEPFPVLRPLNSVASAVIQSGTMTRTPLWDAGLDGRGQVVQVADTGLDQNSCFFSDATGNVAPTTWEDGTFDLSRRKVVQLVADGDAVDVASGHGTHCAGTVAGSCSTSSAAFDYNYKGVAFNAKIAFYDGGKPNGALAFPSNMQLKFFPPGYDAGARVFSNSWGSNFNTYTYMDSEFDGWMATHPDSLVLAAAGNTGASGFKTVFSPALSKNALAVGASQSLRHRAYNVDNVAMFSARGPTADGRIKPDVLAPGSVVFSANASSDLAAYTCTVIGKQGTSMATAVVSGAVALIRQYFLEGRYPSGTVRASDALVPTGALLKALVVNSAMPMKFYLTKSDGTNSVPLGLPPDNYQGFGRVALDQVLNLVPGNPLSLYVRNAVAVSEGEVHMYKFSIKGSGATKPFKVTMTWTDPYVPASSGKIVLHDLDLALVRAGQPNVVVYPNELTAGPDKVNTVEKIALYTPAAGDVYTVTVTGTSVATAASQDYALVASGDFVSGAWYCQDPSLGRANADYKTEHCALACTNAAFVTTPICCGSAAGATCDAATAQESASVCQAASARPAACSPIVVAATNAPTRAPSKLPTRVPTLPPTRIPSRAPSTRPTGAPSKRPTTPTTTTTTAAIPTVAAAPSPEPTNLPSLGPAADENAAWNVSSLVDPSSDGRRSQRAGWMVWALCMAVAAWHTAAAMTTM